MVTTDCSIKNYICLDSLNEVITPPPEQIDDCNALTPPTVLTYQCTDDFEVISSSTSAYIDIASTSAIATGLHNTFFSFYIFAFIVIMYIGWRFGVWIYRR